MPDWCLVWNDALGYTSFANEVKGHLISPFCPHACVQCVHTKCSFVATYCLFIHFCVSSCAPTYYTHMINCIGGNFGGEFNMVLLKLLQREGPVFKCLEGDKAGACHLICVGNHPSQEETINLQQWGLTCLSAASPFVHASIWYGGQSALPMARHGCRVFAQGRKCSMSAVGAVEAGPISWLSHCCTCC